MYTLGPVLGPHPAPVVVKDLRRKLDTRAFELFDRHFKPQGILVEVHGSLDACDRYPDVREAFDYPIGRVLPLLCLTFSFVACRRAPYPAGRPANQPNISPKRPTTFSSTSRSDTSASSSLWRLVTPYSLIPQGVMRSNHERLVLTFSAKPWEVMRPLENLTPIAAILLPFAHTPVYSGCRPPSSP